MTPVTPSDVNDSDNSVSVAIQAPDTTDAHTYGTSFRVVMSEAAMLWFDSRNCMAK